MVKNDTPAEIDALLKQLKDIQRALDESSIVAITDANGVINYANVKFCEISKYSADELIGKTHRIINSGYHPREFFKEMWETIISGRVWRGEICNKAKDGALYWVKTTIVPFLDEDARPFQYVSIRTEITDRKRVEAEILKLNAELEERVQQRTEHLEALNRELSGMVQLFTTREAELSRHITALQQYMQQSSLAMSKQFDQSLLAGVAPAETDPGAGGSSLQRFGLSEREIEVLSLIVEGKTNKEIADNLCITLHTVKAHVSNIIQKMDVMDRTQAAVKAIRMNLVKTSV